MSAVLSSPAAPPAHWRLPLVLLGGVLLLLLWQYRSTFSAMVGIWESSGTFAHAFLVPPITLWLVWRQREALANFSPAPQPWVLLPMALCALAWMVGEIAGVNAITQLAATALLVLAVPALLGWPVARALTFPLLFLFFMVPVGEFVMPTMMDWTADVTIFTLRVIGIPVYREGLQFVIPSGSWSVVEACSGVRYLIASFMVGTLFAYLNYNSNRRRWAFVLFSLAVPVVANWARAVMIVLLGHYSGNKLAVGVDHLIYGWVFFGVVIGIMFFVGARWAEAIVEPPRPMAGGVSAAFGPAQWAAAAATALVMALPPLVTQQMASVALKTPVLTLPELAGVSLDTSAPAVPTPVFENARAERMGVYGTGAAAVTVHIAYYRQQSYGRKLISSQNTLVKSNDHVWRRTARGTTTLQAAGQAVVLRTAELRSGNLRGAGSTPALQVRQIYWVNGRLTASDHVAALLGVFGQLTGQGDDAAAITFYMADDGQLAGPPLNAFIATHLNAITSWLANVRADR